MRPLIYLLNSAKLLHCLLSVSFHMDHDSELQNRIIFTLSFFNCPVPDERLFTNYSKCSFFGLIHLLSSKVIFCSQAVSWLTGLFLWFVLICMFVFLSSCLKELSENSFLHRLLFWKSVYGACHSEGVTLFVTSVVRWSQFVLELWISVTWRKIY
jgi:hypothetical protein